MTDDSRPARSTSPSRRVFLGSALGATGGLALAGCGSVAAGEGTKLRYWNLFGGGDGELMAGLQDTFRRQNPDLDFKGMTLLWGAPYYTKLSMAAAGGRAPEVAILHLARLPSFAPGRLLDPFDDGLLAEVGLSRAQFLPQMMERATVDGRVYALPLDTHPFVMYYNTAVCEQAGLLGDDGKLRPLTGPDAVTAALAKAREVTGLPGLSLDSGDVMPWRLFWTLYRQMDGELQLPVGGRIGIDTGKALRALRFMRQLTSGGLTNANLDYPGSVALFSGGKTGFLWNGAWEVSTFTNANLPFSMTRFPNIFGNQRTAADSHAFVLPHQRSRDPERTRAAYRFIAFLLRRSATWAQAGHVPAFQPVATSQEYLRLTPQSEYRDVAPDVQLDPPSWFSGSAAELQLQAGGAFQGVLVGTQTPEQALAQFTTAMNTLLATPSPV